MKGKNVFLLALLFSLAVMVSFAGTLLVQSIYVVFARSVLVYCFFSIATLIVNETNRNPNSGLRTALTACTIALSFLVLGVALDAGTKISVVVGVMPVLQALFLTKYIFKYG